jgi:A/G-specific adenine glycosylase
LPRTLAPARTKNLVHALLRWYRRHHRPLPWRETREPYPVWVSEIMLQQTRVTAVLPYYGRFLERLPDVEALARAPEQELLGLWSGLGYYRRARQMQQAARHIVEEHGGEFPRTYDDIRALPGIGSYTAAAIASISFHLPYAVVDGNVLRVLTRLFNEKGDVAKAPVRKRIEGLAQSLGEIGAPRSFGVFNQAVMELGATLCVPRNPRCLLCPLMKDCEARKAGVEQQRPVKRRTERTERLAMNVAVVRRGANLLMRQRPDDASLMPGFWELPEAAAPRLGDDCFDGLGISLREPLGTFRHGITFRDYRGSVYRGSLQGKAPPQYHWVSSRRLETLPLTTVTRKALLAVSNVTGVKKKE